VRESRLQSVRIDRVVPGIFHDVDTFDTSSGFATFSPSDAEKENRKSKIRMSLLTSAATISTEARSYRKPLVVA
jgi:hypothetical protein